MESNLVSIFGVNGQLLLSMKQGQAFMAINHDAFANGFEEQEKCVQL